MPVSRPITALVAPEDAEVIATQIAYAGAHAKPKRKIPFGFDLASAIADITDNDTMEGSSTLTISLIDPDWALIESGFLDADNDGKLEPLIDINYPLGSIYWWRLNQVEYNISKQDANASLVFLERLAVRMMNEKGKAIKVSRGKMTRAEFIRHLVTTTDKHAVFVCSQLHKKQPITPADTTP